MDSAYFRSLLNRFKKEIPSDFDASPLAAKRGLNKIIVDAAKQLSPHAAKMVGANSTTFYKHLKKVGMFERPAVNGYVKTNDNWKTYQIYVNEGLMMFCHKFVKLFASRVVAMSDGKPKEHAEIPVSRTVACAKQLLAAFWSKTIYNTVGFNLMQLSDFQVKFAGITLHHAETFVVAHEFGHIIINTSSSKPPQLAFAEDALKTILSRQSEQNDLDSLVSAWGQEIASDLIGLGLCLQCGGDDWDRIRIYSGVEFLLIAQHMLETFYKKKFNRQPPTGDHPPSKLRLEFIRSVVNRDNPASVAQIGNALEELSNNILESI